MKQIIFEVNESLDGGYGGSALGHRIHTQGEGWEDLKAMIRDAVQVSFEDADRLNLIRIICHP